MREYVKTLLAEGIEVLNSRIPSGSRLIVDLVNNLKYHKWAMNCLTILADEAPDHVAQIKSVYDPAYNIYDHAEKIFAIVNSAAEYLNHKDKQRELTKNEKPRLDVFNLDFLHPMLKEKCQEHFNSGKYDDAVLNACKVVEVRTRELANLKEIDVGVNLMKDTFNPKKPILKYSDVNAEQEALMFLFAGFIGVFKNPQSHRFIDIKDPAVAFEILTFANQLCRILDQMKP